MIIFHPRNGTRNMNSPYKFFLLLFMVFKDICSLSKIEVRIPRYIQAGDTADLICSYYLDSHNLYSVKWYKGRHEFYRFMPNENPPVKIFPVKGMKINMTASDHVRVVLESVSTKLSGTYLCEVTVTPTFFALAETANMTVIDFPSEGPVINVERKQFQVGETAHLSCSVQRSSPPSRLSWYINDEPAHEIYVSRIFEPGPQFLQGKNPVDDLQSLELSFPVTTSHFHNNKVRLKCLATIAGLYWKTADVTFTQEHPKLLQTKDGPPSSAVSRGAIISSGQYYMIFKLTMAITIKYLMLQSLQNGFS